jgi:hypothetical protein
MEDHPDYDATIAEIKAAGFEIEETKGDPFVEVVEVLSREGEMLEVKKTVSLRAGMRFLDLEHELGHVRQLTQRFGSKPPPTKRRTRKADGRETDHNNQTGILTTRQSVVLEYHNRLVEFLRLSDRGVDEALLREHARGVAEWRGLRRKKTGRSKSIRQWEGDHFADLAELESRYRAASGPDLE